MRRHVCVAFALAASGLLSAGCSKDPVVKGTVTVVGDNPRFGSWQVTATDCDAGLTLSGSGHAVHVMSSTIDPFSGTYIEVASCDGSPPATLYPSDCRKLDVQIQNDGTGSNDFDGYVVADCDLPGGGAVQASVAWDDCPVYASDSN